MLPGDILTPMKGLPKHMDPATVSPVSISDVNFIDGGVLLCSAHTHQSLDVNGQLN